MKSLDIPLLLTTGMSVTHPTNRKIIFLGEWCRAGENVELYATDKYAVFNFHWNDREKFNSNYEYLEQLTDRLCKHLSIWLNEYHHLDKSAEYWGKLLNPWLLTYVASFFDRWESLRLFFNNHSLVDTFLSADSVESVQFDDYDQFLHLIISDGTNFLIYSDIIKKYYLKNINNKSYIEVRKEKFKNGKNRKDLRKLLTGIRSLLNYLIEKLFTPKIYIFEGGMNRFDMWRILLKLGEFPFQSTFSFKNYIQPKISRNFCKREALAQFDHLGDGVNLFEKYILSIIAFHVPVAYVEGYTKNLELIKKISIKPNVIITSIGHWYNDLFKLWYSELANKTKLVLVQHGGSLNDGCKCQFNYETRTADFRIVCGAPASKQEIQLPFLKLRAFQARNRKIKKEVCGIVGYETAKYAYRADNGPISSQSQLVFNQSITFFEGLSQNIKNYVLIKPYPAQGWWDTRTQYTNKLGGARVSSEKSYYDFIGKCKLVVVTYPLTAFGESLALNVPTILIYSKELWEFPKNRVELLQEMENAGIVFSDEKLAASHINSVWQDLDAWWNSQLVSKCKDRFIKEVMMPSNKDSLNLWSQKIKKIIN